MLPLVTSMLLFLSDTASAAVAIGVGEINPANPGECLDPDTGNNHTLGVAWNIGSVCGQAHCELRGDQVYISYAFCGSADAEPPCYLTATDLSLPYPYCCPRGVCPSRIDVHTNEINTEDYDDDLDMAAATFNSQLIARLAPPTGFSRVQPNSLEQESELVTYDTADQDDDDYSWFDSSSPIDWGSLVSSMSSPVVLDISD